MPSLADLPWEVLVKIFQFAETNGRVLTFLALANRPFQHNRLSLTRPIKKSSRPKIRRILRRVCKLFKDVVDSSFFWRLKTLVLSANVTDRRTRGLEQFIENCCVCSLELVNSRKISLSNNMVFRNLKHLSLSSSRSLVEHGVLSQLSDCKLESLEIFGKAPRTICFDEYQNLLTSLIPFAGSLKSFSFGYHRTNSGSTNTHSWSSQITIPHKNVNLIYQFK